MAQQLKVKQAIRQTRERGVSRLVGDAIAGGVGGIYDTSIIARDQSWHDTGYVLPLPGEIQVVDYFLNAQFPTHASHPQSGITKRLRTEIQMKTPGAGLPAPDEYSTVGLNVHLCGRVSDGLGPPLRDIKRIMAHGLLRYVQNNKELYTFWLRDFTGPGFTGDGSAGSSGAVYNLGPAALADWVQFSRRLDVLTGSRFGWRLEVGPEGAPMVPVRIKIETVGRHKTAAA